jgi:hypothetical protein
MIPYFLIVIIIQLFVMLYFSINLKQKIKIPSKNKKVKQETFNGFYVDNNNDFYVDH